MASSLVVAFRASFLKALEPWQESVTAHRSLEVYSLDTGGTTNGESAIATFNASWQPVTGHTIQDEAGLETKSSARLFCAYDTALQEDDRIERGSGESLRVNYLRNHNTHLEVFLKHEGI